MNLTRSAAIMAAARWSNRSIIARSYGPKNCRMSLRAIASKKGSLLKERALASQAIVGKRLFSTAKEEVSSTSSDALPVHLRNLAEFSRSAALKSLKKGYMVLAPNTKDTPRFYKFGAFFLRENCQCPKCVHPDTKQRIVELDSISPDIAPSKIKSGGHMESVKIIWNDGHESSYPWTWIKQHHAQTSAPKYQMGPMSISHSEPRPFRQFDPTSTNYPMAEFNKVMLEDDSVRDWLEKIQKYGFCFIEGVPLNPESTKALIERIAFVRHTHYGGFWDFTADLTFKDTAYTNESLGVHTDNTYFTDPARLQLFHLLSHTEGTGGESLLVDGLAAARVLLKTHPNHYQTLTQVRHPWHASGNEDVCIQPSYMTPVFSVHPDKGKLYQIRWNNYDRAPKTDWTLGQQNKWYAAARAYDSILNERKRLIQTQLKPGTALIFDNWRMLHGRTEFTGKRRMCGGYVNGDDYISRLRLLKFGREKVLEKLGSHNDHDKGMGSPYGII
ncbi:Trimethyllysine dioxygenase [Penicillium hetheringtonii]|uniref:Trimethyllysine dioxygenase n=1 Tax=Penicillium hetheringtonii TaxID=911720 RepID=A0AAD6GNE5_9EURO|nr:Trimethyllysine dioxygenase [Penicillium hetheringtonii]